MTDEEHKPKWAWKLPEHLFRALGPQAMNIKKVEHGWAFTSEDTSKYWLEIWGADGPMTIIPQHEVGAFFELFEFAPHDTGLLRLTYKGAAAADRLRAIDEFERRNHKERVEYERLKRKFG